MYNTYMMKNKPSTREIKSEYTANGMMAMAPVRNVAMQQNGWTVGKNFFNPTAKKIMKNKSFFSRFL